jgi:hypothetical protein
VIPSRSSPSSRARTPASGTASFLTLVIED